MTLFKRAVLRAALFLFGIIAFFFIAELVIRITPLRRTQFYIYDSDRGWAPRPGARGWLREEGEAYVSINRWGFRGPDCTLAKPPDTLRIAVLGDSFTEAQQVPFEQTFCSVMQTALAKCRASGSSIRNVEVLDFGVDGYGTAQELLTLPQVWKFNPDFVVLAIYTGNDIRNNSVILEDDKCRPFYVFRDGQLVPGGPFEDSLWFRASCRVRFESRHWQSVTWFLSALGRARGAIKNWVHQRRGAPSTRAVTTAATPPVGASAQIVDPIHGEPRDAVSRDAWRVTEGEIAAIAREVAAHHASFLAVTLTNGIQVEPDPTARAKYAGLLGVADLFYPERRIAALGARDGFEVLNLAPPMQAYADAHHVYLHGFPTEPPGYGHWNAIGHRVVGGLIADKICAMMASRLPR